MTGLLTIRDVCGKRGCLNWTCSGGCGVDDDEERIVTGGPLPMYLSKGVLGWLCVLGGGGGYPVVAIR